ncbi:MAG: DUF4199 domain-containing protein [Saprospiraceae bacterium]|nr:DUF4199 domain-containing protein [Saprospiraceae bacterium]
MKQTILRYGLISGAISAALMVATVIYSNSSNNFDRGAIVGYAGILLSMLLVYFGVRHYRDQVAGGVISFGKGFQVGLLIAVVSCVFYVLAWMVVYETIMPDFLETYTRLTVEKMQKAGKFQAEIDQTIIDMQKFGEMYQNPLIRFGLTFLEPFPMGLAVALLSAAILRKGDKNGS